MNMKTGKKEYALTASKQNQRSDRKKKLRRSVPTYLLLTPTLILFLVMGIYPIIWALKYCLYNYDGTTIPIFVGFDNFKKIFDFKAIFSESGNPFAVYWSSWGRTLGYAVIKTLIEIPLSFACALLVTSKVKGRNFFKTLFYMPQILPSFAIFMVFGIMLNPFNGILTKYLSQLGVITQNFSLLANKNSAFLIGILADSWIYFGLNMLFFIAGLTNIPKDVYESASIDGANEAQRLFYITIPMMSRMSQVIIMLSLVGCLKAMGSYFVLTKGGPNHGTELTFMYIYNLFFPSGTTAQYGMGAAVAVVSAVIVGIITAIYNTITEKMQYD
ncbi:carbohydrate ABC transporter permease [Anaerosporobacter sp.]|uniref:carbohydrate ABC transporter permease n=1 Tax=Anaerosporobacter sp. TaxID=1872529 RepID=UPI00286F7A89|nr:sugar ABC transporter permease [Anaerosporobacter sp.]